MSPLFVPIPSLPREIIKGICHRNALFLGLERDSKEITTTTPFKCPSSLTARVQLSRPRTTGTLEFLPAEKMKYLFSRYESMESFEAKSWHMLESAFWIFLFHIDYRFVTNLRRDEMLDIFYGMKGSASKSWLLLYEQDELEIKDEPGLTAFMHAFSHLVGSHYYRGPFVKFLPPEALNRLTFENVFELFESATYDDSGRLISIKKERSISPDKDEREEQPHEDGAR